MIEWFFNIKNMKSSSFIVFDTESFYPSISADLFKSAKELQKFAEESIDISDYNFLLINQAQKTLLFNENTPWVKTEGNQDFDVPMGCSDRVEVCELVGTYSLSQLKDTFEHHSTGLY